VWPVADLGAKKATASPFPNMARKHMVVYGRARSLYATICPPPFNQPPTFKIPKSATGCDDLELGRYLYVGDCWLEQIGLPLNT